MPANTSYMIRPALISAAPRSVGFPDLWVRKRVGALRIPENVEKIGMVVCSGFT
ncbi:hypothetical protein D3C74_490410 [compost metagenome]